VIGSADGTDVDALLDARRTERNHCCWIRVGDNWIRDGENHCYCWTPACRTTRNHYCWTRGDGKKELRSVGHGTARNCCYDAGRREITAAAGCRTARNHSCGREVEKPTAAGRRTERNHICRWGGDKLLLLDEGRQEITAARRGLLARNDCCWTRDGEKQATAVDAK
jgi:hypothetical protein